MTKLKPEDYLSFKKQTEGNMKVNQMAIEANEVLLKWLETKVPKEKKR